MRRDSGFTLIEILIVIALLGVAAAITVMIFNASNIDTKGTSTQLKSDFASIEMAYASFKQVTGVNPTGLTDTAFVPAYLTPPTVNKLFDNTYGTGGYLIALRTGQPPGENGFYIAAKAAVTGISDDVYVAIKKLAAELPAKKFYYNTSVPAVANMADPAGAATVYVTYWCTRY